MNFYPHHLGDYAKDTGHLSVTEHGAYRLLMDHYYSTEKPLPEDFLALYRVCRATSHIEKTAVKSVVAKFFPLENGVRTHKRIEHELSLYRERVDINKANGMKGGRPAKQKPSGFIAGSQNETQTKPKRNPIQKPEANIHDPISKEHPPENIPPAAPESDGRHSQIVKLWEEAYKTQNGEAYAFNGTRDFGELKKLLIASPDLTPENFVRVAKAAWLASSDLYSKAVKNAGTLTGLCLNWNAIRAELNARKAAPDKTGRSASGQKEGEIATDVHHSKIKRIGAE